MSKEAKHSKKENKSKKILLIFLIIIFICGITFIIYNVYNDQKTKKENSEILDNIEIDRNEITESKTERMLQLEKLQEENEDIVAWLEIEDTSINYPVLQATDNSFYMTHNYKKEYSKDGSIFLDKDYNWELPSSNLLIYGHNNLNGNMFQDLLKYKDESYYKEHPNIKFTTNQDDSTYEILAVFYSRVYYKSEKDVFRYYYFINANNEDEYNDFIKNSRKASLYDTGVTAEYGDQLLTLSTCEYSQKDGRFAIVARKVK